MAWRLLAPATLEKTLIRSVLLTHWCLSTFLGSSLPPYRSLT